MYFDLVKPLKDKCTAKENKHKPVPQPWSLVPGLGQAICAGLFHPTYYIVSAKSHPRVCMITILFYM